MKANIKKIVYALAFCGMIAILLLNGSKNKMLKNEDSFLTNYQEFNRYNKVDSTPLVYEVFMNQDKMGYLVFESAYGYQSNITIATLIDMNQIILSVKTYAQNETPAFYNRVENGKFYKNNFIGQKADNGFSIGQNVDAITGATFSSDAITKAVHKGVSFVSNKYFGVSIPSQQSFKFGAVEISLIILLIIVIIAYKTKNKKLRYLALTYSIIILGFKFSTFISYSWFVSVLTLKFPNIADNLKWYLLVGGALGFILITGKNLYCAYICPFGALQEIEYRLGKFHFFKINPKVRKILSLMPGIIAYFAFVMALTSHKLGGLSYEPFSLIYGQSGIDVQWILLPAVILFSLFITRFYCNFGCPVGFVLGLIQKLRKKVVKACTKVKIKGELKSKTKSNLKAS